VITISGASTRPKAAVNRRSPNASRIFKEHGQLRFAIYDLRANRIISAGNHFLIGLKKHLYKH
jgi:hypothetical protein